jgi:hypothetical protein
MNFYSFPSIGQFNSAIRHVKSRTRFAGHDENGDAIYNNDPLPTIRYRGVVKLHGTNSAAVFNTLTEELTFQSRERVLSLEQDNAGFMMHFLSKTEELQVLFKEIQSKLENTPEKIVMYGEWCGGNIQKGVALSGLSKMMVIFGVKLVYSEEDMRWMDITDLELNRPELSVYSALSFPTYELDIDFEHPERVQNKIIELVEAVETECPVARAFGNSGIGEGLVWSPVAALNDSGYWFKTKGEKHSVSKVKTVAAVDVEAIESVNKFVETYVTENRMDQMLDVMTRERLVKFEMENLGTFIRMVFQDVLKETSIELSENNIDPKKLGSPISTVARRWYINKFNQT